jgi:pyruvate,water dikinase
MHDRRTTHSHTIVRIRTSTNVRCAARDVSLEGFERSFAPLVLLRSTVHCLPLVWQRTREVLCHNYEEPQMTASSFTRRFAEIGMGDVPSVGGKNASLGEMFRELTAKGIRVPDGFAVTAEAYRQFLRANTLDRALADLLGKLDIRDLDSLRHCGHQIRQLILQAEFPPEIATAILAAYAELEAGAKLPAGVRLDVAVRSSATAEDLPDASFAGQQETYLNVQGPAALLDTCRRCFASLFTDRAISYRIDKGFDHLKVALSVGVQRMVRSDLASSGVMFSIDTETGFSDAVLINAAYGLGENVVQGSVNPDEFCVFKPTLKQGFRPIIKRSLGSKEFKLIYDLGGSRMVRNVPVPAGDRAQFALTDDEVLELARCAVQIEEHYSKLRGGLCPMDMEWAKDGQTGEFFIVQARPETVQSQRHAQMLETYRLKATGRVLATGRSVGSQIAAGPVRKVESIRQLQVFQQGEVLVTDKTDPDWEPIMKRAAAIVTNRGGRTCHAAIVSRELGIPAVVGTEHGTEALSDGQLVTVSCAEGDTGLVYEGALAFDVDRVDLSSMGRPRTKIMVNVGNPDEALGLSFLPNDGVGLARMEFIINNHIQIHPMALVRYDVLEDAALKQEIDRRTAGYANKPRYFVDRLAEGVAMIAAAFYPRDVIVRMSDFKTNEYAHLVGGQSFEPSEENPMIGFRGASRYYDPRYREGFALECQAMRKVREEMGFVNVKLMVPFCRTVEEGRRVIAEMRKHGLEQRQNGLEIYVMCEIPSNVISAKEFAEVFDGFSIGSNDLTQLILGVDRDSSTVAHLFDERNPAVMDAIASAIRTVKAAGKKIGICGQAPSDYPEFAEFLIRQGIDSISLNPDAVVRTTQRVLATEREFAERREWATAPS